MISYFHSAQWIDQWTLTSEVVPVPERRLVYIQSHLCFWVNVKLCLGSVYLCFSDVNSDADLNKCNSALCETTGTCLTCISVDGCHVYEYECKRQSSSDGCVSHCLLVTRPMWTGFECEINCSDRSPNLTTGTRASLSDPAFAIAISGTRL